MLESAGRTALAVLRQGKRRAKLGSLHLPISFHPARQQAIVLSPLAETSPDDQTVASVSTSADEPAVSTPPTRPDAATGSPASGPGPDTRALRGKLVAAERRQARLRNALERERLAHLRAGVAVRQPQSLIDQLVADIGGLEHRDEAAVRRAICAVLGAHGFQVPTPPRADPAPGTHPPLPDRLPTLPGWDQRRVQAAITGILTRQPEIGGRRTLYLALDALARYGSVTPSRIAAEAGLTSPLARHRLRLALEALGTAGVAKRDGQHFVAMPPPATRD